MRTEFRFCPACATPLQLRQVEGRPLAACPNCEFVHWRGPQVAVAMIAQDQSGRVLAIRRGMAPGKGGWALPGGYVDGDEDPVRSAERECWEETGCRVAAEQFTGAFHVLVPGDSLVVLAYSGHLTGGEAVPTPEAPELAWFQPAELPEMIFTSHRQALRACPAVPSRER